MLRSYQSSRLCKHLNEKWQYCFETYKLDSEVKALCEVEKLPFEAISPFHIMT